MPGKGQWLEGRAWAWKSEKHTKEQCLLVMYALEQLLQSVHVQFSTCPANLACVAPVLVAPGSKGPRATAIAMEPILPIHESDSSESVLEVVEVVDVESLAEEPIVTSAEMAESFLKLMTVLTLPLWDPPEKVTLLLASFVQDFPGSDMWWVNSRLQRVIPNPLVGATSSRWCLLGWILDDDDDDGDGDGFLVEEPG